MKDKELPSKEQIQAIRERVALFSWASAKDPEALRDLLALLDECREHIQQRQKMCLSQLVSGNTVICVCPKCDRARDLMERIGGEDV
jgi:hypothetical protein